MWHAINKLPHGVWALRDLPQFQRFPVSHKNTAELDAAATVGAAATADANVPQLLLLLAAVNVLRIRNICRVIERPRSNLSYLFITFARSSCGEFN